MIQMARNTLTKMAATKPTQLKHLYTANTVELVDESNS